MDDYRTVLGASERDRVWRSTFNGALYRWNETTWQVKTKIADWHPVRPGTKALTVYGQSGERFEVSE